MGACQSCLGRRDSDALREDEEAGLLYEEEHVNYGSFGEPDSTEAQRENEAIQSVVAKTSNNMVDVFEIGPHAGGSQGPSPHFAYTGQGARLARYQRLVSKLNNKEENPPGDVKVDWLLDDDTIELHRNRPDSVKTNEGDDGALVGTFADAAFAASTTSNVA